MIDKKVADTAPPEISVHDFYTRRRREMLNSLREGKRVLKWNDIPWEQNVQSHCKWYASERDEGAVAAPGWHIHRQQLKDRNGRHIHQGGICLFVIKGTGYSVIDGVKYPWKQNDLVTLPFSPGGVDHQHFNANPAEPCELIALGFYLWNDLTASMNVQKEAHKGFKG